MKYFLNYILENIVNFERQNVCTLRRVYLPLYLTVLIKMFELTTRASCTFESTTICCERKIQLAVG